MVHESGIIITITGALVCAAIGGYIAARLRLPPIVGFIVAGVAVGPFTPGYTADNEIAGQLAEIGIILLMFGVGIHFSIRDLRSVLAIAVSGAVIQTFVMTGAATALIVWWGWGWQAGIIIGLSLSIASTVILVHTLTVRNQLDTKAGRVGIGWLIIEDLLTVLALVLIPVIFTSGAEEAASGGEIGETVAITLGEVALLSAIMIFVGARVVPWVLVQVARTGSRELFSLSVLAVALGIAWVSASVFDVSLALGAFLAGLVISESDFSHQAAADALPLRDAFAVLFFVSVGMLFDPGILIDEPVLLVIFLAFVLLAKPVITAVILLIGRFQPRDAMLVSASRAQIGEFSFILGGLGLTLGVLPEAGNNLILATAIISIILNPLMFRAILPLDEWMRGRPKINRLATHPVTRDMLSTPESNGVGMRGHAIICGYGRVGSLVGETLNRRGFPYIVVELNRGVIEELRNSGTPAFFGDATNKEILAHLNISFARVLVVALPDPITARFIVEKAQELNPTLPIVVRTHSEREWEFYTEQQYGEAIMGERELALEMTHYTLRRFGISAREAQAIVQRLRARRPIVE